MKAAFYSYSYFDDMLLKLQVLEGLSKWYGAFQVEEECRRYFHSNFPEKRRQKFGRDSYSTKIGGDSCSTFLDYSHFVFTEKTQHLLSQQFHGKNADTRLAEIHAAAQAKVGD